MRRVWMGVLLAGLGAASVSAALQATGIVAHWELDNPTPTDDLSANNNDGTMTGAPVVGTDVPSAISAFSTNSLRVGPGLQYLQAGNATPLDQIQNGSYTLSAWFKPASYPPSTGTNSAYAVIMKAGYNEGLYYQNNGAGGGVFAMEHWTTNDDGMGGSVVTPNTTGTWPYPSWAINQWYHLAGVVDATGRSTKLVVTPLGSAPTVTTTAWAASVTGNSWAAHAGIPWTIGVAVPNHATVQWQADGTIDDVRIYNRVLTDPEIAAIAAGTDLGLATLTPAPTPPTPTPPVAGSNKEGEEGCSCSVGMGRFSPVLLAFATVLLAFALVPRKGMA
jgi:hypothetical protein